MTKVARAERLSTAPKRWHVGRLIISFVPQVTKSSKKNDKRAARRQKKQQEAEVRAHGHCPSLAFVLTAFLH